MKRKPSLGTVAVALAVIAGLAIASPVFGLSNPIKKAIQKEVAKRIAGATGPQGPPGANGVAGAPIAYAHLTAGGNLDSAQTKDISLVGVGPGTHCLRVTADREPRSAIATLEATSVGTPKDGVRATVDPGVVHFNCPQEANLLVETVNQSGTGEHKAFYVAVN